MQPWQCIALIVLTVAVFLYATFLDEINKTAESSLTSLVEQTSPPREESSLSESNISSTWAEVSLYLDTEIEEDYALSFHIESIDSEKFHRELFDELRTSPMAKELILRPFTSELLEGNEIEILASLISIKTRSPKSLEIICKGHSIRAANLLSELLLRNYQKLLAAETSTSPTPVSLIEKFQKYQSYEEQLGELKILIQKDIEGAPEESVEVMAIRSEIMQLDEEINRFKNYLLQIDEIHKKKSDPNEYLDIPPIRDFGQVSQIADILEQLKAMRLDDSLNPFTRDQVEKNILANSKELEKEVVTAIEKIKADVTGALAKKKELQQAAFDHISESSLARSKNKNLATFNKIEQVTLEAKKKYEDAYLLWMSCKSSYTLYRASK